MERRSGQEDGRPIRGHGAAGWTGWESRLVPCSDKRWRGLSSLGWLCWVALIGFGMAVPASAQEPAEAFRGELLEAVGLLRVGIDPASELATSDLATLSRVEGLEAQILGLDVEALEPLATAVQKNGAWQSSLQRLRQAVGELDPAEGSAALVAPAAFRGPAELGVTEGEISPPYSSNCGDQRPSTQSLFLGLLLTNLFESLEIAGQSICDVATSGDLNALNVVVCGITAVLGEARLLAESSYESNSLCSGDVDSAEINAAYLLADQIDGVVEDNLDAQVSTRATQDSLDQHATEVDAELATVESQLALAQSDLTGLVSGVANLQAELDDVQVRVTDTQLGVDDLETRVSDIEQSVDDLRLDFQDLTDTTDELTVSLDDFIESSQGFEALNLQILIEGDLERKGTAAVSLFQLPSAVGGYLEVVREIVLATIEANEAADQSVGNASEAVTEGDAAFDSGAYRDAYQLYRDAYHQATGRLSP